MSASPRPVLIVVAGPNGSGKTSLTMEVLRHRWFDGCIYLNPDNIARDLLGDWRSKTYCSINEWAQPIIKVLRAP